MSTRRPDTEYELGGSMVVAVHQGHHDDFVRRVLASNGIVNMRKRSDGNWEPFDDEDSDGNWVYHDDDDCGENAPDVDSDDTWAYDIDIPLPSLPASPSAAASWTKRTKHSDPESDPSEYCSSHTWSYGERSPSQSHDSPASGDSETEAASGAGPCDNVSSG